MGNMKFIAALIAAASAVNLKSATPCTPAIDVSEKQLNIELDYFSRNFDKTHYDTAMTIYNELKGQGKDPKVKIHTWELYDKSFRFPRVRRYVLVQKHMDVLEHFQDNLSQNFTNGQAFDNFIRVAHEAEDALNAKNGADDGGFYDPANFDPTCRSRSPGTTSTRMIPTPCLLESREVTAR